MSRPTTAERIAALSPQRRMLLELERRRRAAASAEARGAAGAAEPFSLIGETDRRRLPEGLEDAYPMTTVQVGMVYHMELTADEPTPAYQNVNSFHFDAAFDAELFRRAVQDVVARHPVLRTGLHLTGFSQPMQLVHRHAEMRLRIEDLRHLPALEQQARLRDFNMETLRTPADLTRPPLVSLSVHLRSQGSFQLTLSEPHAISDGWSTHANLIEIFERYFAYLRGESPPVAPPPRISMRDLVALERQAHQSPESEAFWRRSLAGCEILEVPSWRSGGEAAEHTLDRKLRYHVSEEVAEGLERLGRLAGAPVKSVLLAAHLKAIGLITGRTDVLTGISMHCRPESAESTEVRGMFLTTLPFRLDVARSSWRELCGATFATEREIWPHRYFPASSMLRWVGGETLFETSFAYLHFHSAEPILRSGEIKVAAYGGIDYSVAHFPLSAVVTRSLIPPYRLQLCVGFDDVRFSRAQVGAVLRLYVRILEAMAADPEASPETFCPLDRSARHQLLVEWNDSRGPVPAERCLHRLFDARARACPDRVAVAAGGEMLSYGELRRRAAGLAASLVERGAAPGRVVAVSAERSVELPVALLGILDTGAAYLPLSPDDPAQRHAFLLRDAGATLVVADRRHAGALAAHRVEVLELGAAEPRRGGFSPVADADAADLAYVIYTSGSTGRPKGVMMSHGGIYNRIGWMLRRFPPGDGETVLLKTPLVFDASVWEVFYTLLGGGRLEVAAPDAHRDPLPLARAVAERRVTTLQLVPSMLRLLLEEPAFDRCRDLRRMFCGGELLPPELARRFRERSAAELHNLYGPTEVAIDASHHPCSAAEPPAAVPIGRPLDDVRIYLLASGFQPVPLATEGEVCVAGGGLARGYLGRPALSAERFVPDPFSARPGERLYRTGDLGRWRSEGTLEFVRRMDAQVKLHGLRIEPGEVEAAIADDPRVLETAVVVHAGAGGEPRLVAYVVPRRERSELQAETPTIESHRRGRDAELWPCVGEYQVYDEVLYYAMNKDETRNQLWRRAIGLRVRDRVVLDVGTGREPIWAIESARAGARHVYALELLEESYREAVAHVRRLGLEDRITVLQGDVRSLPELPEPVDVCLANLIGTIGGSEGQGPAMDEVRRLLSSDGVFLPSRCETLFAAVTLPEELRRDPGFPPVAAHYVERVFAAVGRPFDVRLCLRNVGRDHLLSSFDVFERLDFSRPTPPEATLEAHLHVEKEGRLDGFLLWLSLELAPGIVLENLDQESVWLPVYLPVFEPGLHVSVGDRVTASCRSRLGEDGFHPDYQVRGTVLRRSGGSVDFAVDSPFVAPRLGGHPFYASLFEDAAPRVVAPRLAGGALMDGLRQDLGGRLPAHMVPAAFVELGALPRTPGGKLDRRALPDPAAPETGESRRLPSTLVEELVAGPWAEVLGVERVEADRSFFDLGGDSLGATRLISRLRQVFGVELQLRDLFVAPTLAGIGQRVEAALRSEATLVPPPIEAVPRDGELLPSFAQERLWLVEQVDTGTTAFSVPIAVRLSGPLDVAAFLRALSEIERRHEVLRASFPARDQRPSLEISPPAPVPVVRVDLSALPAAEAEAQALALARLESARPFDLTRGPLWRSTLVELAEADHVALLTLHHAVSDGWSMGVLVREISTLYGAFSSGRPSPLPELEVQYADFAAWQRRWLSGEVLERLLDYWRRRLAGCEPPPLPLDRPRSAHVDYRGARHRGRLDAETSRRLVRLAREEGATLFVALLTAFKTLLYRLSGHPDVVVGTDVANRTSTETEALIGFFVNLLPLRTSLAGTPSFRELLGRVRETALGAYSHQDLPFARLVEELQREREPGRSPIFDALFVLQNTPPAAIEVEGLSLRPFGVVEEPARFDLAVFVHPTGAELVVSWSYRKALFDRETVVRLAERFETLLADAVRRPDARLDELVTSPAEKGANEDGERRSARLATFKTVKPKAVETW